MFMKMIEIRDSMTCIPTVAIKMLACDPVEQKFLWRCGYPKDGSSITLMRLSDQKATNDPYGWHALGTGLRTMQVAHDYILKYYDTLRNGQVVDVRTILGEAEHAATPEIAVGF